MWCVYIIECKDRSLYTGITMNIERRLKEHNSKKGGKYTKVRNPVKLIYKESYKNKGNALKREIQIKGWSKRKKLALAGGDIELLKQLSKKKMR
ncbi:hypothetical protein CH333_08450 [candidate division WOR-3 bacterium JGI_Cruoil_03_44_89]|uniref:GIY-YIG domain-containing protein n=1 Tax=candidate division WOR-3 bacterium JGI_Cruoil_03_44_89 TaxID=1973748 RepID=A0A235BPV4_UNCW3|nr:MAG: hypothetical protein CH333_08450 [candidate division WOR-3 bacterium JGI_Cruoil_03_44_89]